MDCIWGCFSCFTKCKGTYKRVKYGKFDFIKLINVKVLYPDGKLYKFSKKFIKKNNTVNVLAIKEACYIVRDCVVEIEYRIKNRGNYKIVYSLNGLTNDTVLYPMYPDQDLGMSPLSPYLSINYNNWDMTDIYKKYEGPRGDYHKGITNMDLKWYHILAFNEVLVTIGGQIVKEDLSLEEHVNDLGDNVRQN